MKEVGSTRYAVAWMIVLAAVLSIVFPASSEADEIRLMGQTFVNLEEVAGRFGLESSWVERGKSMRLTSRWSDLRFERDKREVRVNGSRVHLGFAPVLRNGKLYLSQLDIEKTLQPILTPQVFREGCPRLYRIVLDPGHGGRDAGAQNAQYNLREKDLALQVAKRLQARLASYGYQVLLTRDQDRFLSLTERATYANSVQADLFVSIHFNAAGDHRVEGIESYVFTPQFMPSTARSGTNSNDNIARAANRNDVWNMAAAFALQSRLVENIGGSDRGVKRARFTVLRDLQMPGVLLELGFLSHPETALRLRTAAFQDELVRTMVEGILEYQRTLNRVRGRG